MFRLFLSQPLICPRHYLSPNLKINKSLRIISQNESMAWHARYHLFLMILKSEEMEFHNTGGPGLSYPRIEHFHTGNLTLFFSFD